MIVITRKKDERIVIDDCQITVAVGGIREDIGFGRKVELRVLAPDQREIRLYGADGVNLRRTLQPNQSNGWAVALCKRDESLVVGDDVKIMVIEIRGDRVRLGVEAPKGTTIQREEVIDAIKRCPVDLGDGHTSNLIEPSQQCNTDDPMTSSIADQPKQPAIAANSSFASAPQEAAGSPAQEILASVTPPEDRTTSAEQMVHEDAQPIGQEESGAEATEWSEILEDWSEILETNEASKPEGPRIGEPIERPAGSSALVASRKPGQAFVIDGNIWVTTVSIHGSTATLRITGPERHEVLRRKPKYKDAKRAAAVYANEVITIGDLVTLWVVEIRGDKVRFGIIAPRTVPVHRAEVWDAICVEERLGSDAHKAVSTDGRGTKTVQVDLSKCDFV